MDTTRRWAKEWQKLEAPKNDASSDALFAEFTNAEGNSVRVEITIQDLKDFGDAPRDLSARAQHTEQVLRAVLETYIQKLGRPPAVINAKDLSMHGLDKLEKDFAKDHARTEGPDM